MGSQDYNDGFQNPYAPVDYTSPGAGQFQQGQYDAARMGKGYAASGGSMAPARVSSDPTSPLCVPRKNQFLGVVCCIFGGPLGLFYSSKKAALIMLAAVAAAVTRVAAPDHTTVAAPASLAALLTAETLWPAAAAVSVVWSILAISGFNRRAAAKDAAALAEWLATRKSAPPA